MAVHFVNWAVIHVVFEYLSSSKARGRFRVGGGGGGGGQGVQTPFPYSCMKNDLMPSMNHSACQSKGISALATAIRIVGDSTLIHRSNRIEGLFYGGYFVFSFIYKELEMGTFSKNMNGANMFRISSSSAFYVRYLWKLLGIEQITQTCTLISLLWKSRHRSRF